MITEIKDEYYKVVSSEMTGHEGHWSGQVQLVEQSDGSIAYSTEQLGGVTCPEGIKLNHILESTACSAGDPHGRTRKA